MTPSLVDSHCHLNYEPLRNRIPQVLQNARDQGVGHMLCVAVNLEKLPEVLDLAQSHSHIYASVGVHPDEQQVRDPEVDELVDLAANPRVVAIGETGLDYYRLQGERDWQQQRFRRHIQASRQCGKPLIIHTREAAADTLRIMREEGAESAGGVMHCFTESWDTAKAALDLGFYISISGIVTFRNAAALREVAKQIPADRLLIETDAPYLAPVPHRGQVNEPAFVRHVAEQLAELRKTDYFQLAATTTDNFFSLFRHARQ